MSITSLSTKSRPRQLDPGGPGPGPKGHGHRGPGLPRQRLLGHQVQDPAQHGRLHLEGLHRGRGGRFRTAVLMRSTVLPHEPVVILILTLVPRPVLPRVPGQELGRRPAPRHARVRQVRARPAAGAQRPGRPALRGPGVHARL